MRRQIVKLLAITAALAGCSTQVADTSGGAETTNGFVVITSNGTPISGADVQFVSNSEWLSHIESGNSPVIETAVSDEAGFVNVPAELQDYSVQVVSGNEAVLFKNRPDTVQLSPLRTVSGTLSGSGVLYVAESNWKTVLDAGAFSLNVPDGVYSLVYESGDERSVASTIVVENDTSDVQLESNRSGVLFDDFNGGFSHNTLGDVLDTTWWYTFSDSVRYIFREGAWAFNGISSHNGGSSLVPSMEEGVFSVKVVLSDNASTPFAGIGASVYSEKPYGYDLTEMTQLNLRARGTGEVQVSLECDSLDSLGSSQYHVDITLRENWEEIRIPVDQFKLNSKDSTVEQAFPWSSAAENIRNIEFIFRASSNSINDTLSLEIDNIVFEGSSLPL